MNAEAFMALVAKHPLPWRLDADDGGIWFIKGRWGMDSDKARALADAAPAMAAAIIRLLRAHLIRHDHGGPEAYQDALDKMREALPAELRVEWPGD